MHKILSKTNLSNENKKFIEEEINYFCNTMELHEHRNLRTFQFFLSKISYLLNKIDEIKKISKHKKEIKKQIIKEAFLSAVTFKSNYKPTNCTSIWSSITKEETSTVIKKYVENGKFLIEKFEEYIIILQNEMTVSTKIDDPYCVILNYYYHTQKECETALEQLLTNLKKKEYPVSIYTNIIIAIQHLVDLGYPSQHIENAKEIMLENISTSEELNEIDPKMFIFENENFTNNIRTFINDINDAIRNHSATTKRNIIQEILESETWVYDLEKYINSNQEKYKKNIREIAIFSIVPSDLWVSTIKKSNPNMIYDFKNLLNEIYPTSRLSILQEAFRLDEIAITDIKDKLNIIKDNETDLNKKEVLSWLCGQFEEIIIVSQKYKES